jgi:hypothetical protein
MSEHTVRNELQEKDVAKITLQRHADSDGACTHVSTFGATTIVSLA